MCNDDLTAFTLRFSYNQWFAMMLRGPDEQTIDEFFFFEAKELIEFIRARNEQFQQDGRVHDVGGGVVLVSYTGSIVTVMAL